MFSAVLWTAIWKLLKKNFDVDEVFNLSKVNGGVPLEMHFLDGRKHMYITTTNPSLSHTFDLSGNASKPKLGKSLVIGQGAHHVGLTRDGHYGFVQKSFVNFPGMRDDLVSGVDLQSQKAVASMDTLKTWN